MTPERARKILNVSAEAEADAVRFAYRRALFDLHPDTAGGATAPFDANEIRAARDCLLSGATTLETPCKMCAGRGSIHGRRCLSCDGTGAKP